jgi:hypothetical protein
LIAPSTVWKLDIGLRLTGALVAVVSTTGIAVFIFIVGPSFLREDEAGFRVCGERVSIGAAVGTFIGIVVILLAVGSIVIMLGVGGCVVTGIVLGDMLGYATGIIDGTADEDIFVLVGELLGVADGCPLATLGAGLVEVTANGVALGIGLATVAVGIVVILLVVGISVATFFGTELGKYVILFEEGRYGAAVDEGACDGGAVVIFVVGASVAPLVGVSALGASMVKLNAVWSRHVLEATLICARYSFGEQMLTWRMYSVQKLLPGCTMGDWPLRRSDSSPSKVNVKLEISAGVVPMFLLHE